MLKGTSLASTVTLLDITGVAKFIISTTFRPIEVFIVAGVFIYYVSGSQQQIFRKKYRYQ